MIAALSEPVAIIAALDEAHPDLRAAIQRASFSIGRDPACDLCISDDRTVSRRHCTIHCTEAGLTIQDNGSRNGTFLNGVRLNGTAPLPMPSTLVVGKTRLAVVPASLDGAPGGRTGSGDATQGALPLAGALHAHERTEAFLVVDLVNSTGLVRQGDVEMARVVLELRQVLEQALQAEREGFLKCTGDGFFACFSSSTAALQAAHRLGPDLAGRVALPLQLSVALHRGSASVTALGDRIGGDVHAVFDLENLRRVHRDLAHELQTGDLPVLTLMTEDFWADLDPAERSRTVLLGRYPLKGLDREVRIYRWTR